MRHSLQSVLTVFIVTMSLYSCSPTEKTNNQLVRLAIISVDTTQIEQYNQFLKEEIQASIEKEPGVITLYAVAEKENPHHVTLFETYADSAQYRSHLTTPHFQKYKQGTLNMVTHLELIESKPLLYHRKPNLTETDDEQYFIRLIKMEIDSTAIADFEKLAQSVMLPGLADEPGVLMMYAVAEKKIPTRISVLEVYADSLAYEKHVKTPHFQKYKAESKSMVRSLTIRDVNSIMLGSKVKE
jgi:quinol monooxygenase YgiN